MPKLIHSTTFNKLKINSETASISSGQIATAFSDFYEPHYYPIPHHQSPYRNHPASPALDYCWQFGPSPRYFLFLYIFTFEPIKTTYSAHFPAFALDRLVSEAISNFSAPTATTSYSAKLPHPARAPYLRSL